MGLPIKHRKKFVSHKKRWDKATILEESKIVEDYALKNKKEIRKIEESLSHYKTIAKDLNKTAETKESEQAQNFIAKMKKLGFLDVDAQSLDEVLDITIRDILDRRLSNIVYKLKLSRTPRQARQFIVHGHVLINGRCVDSPSCLISLEEEANLEFKPHSSLSDEAHPERVLASGGMIEVEEMKEIPLTSEAESFDEKEAKLDDEEQDEVAK
ncbi:MAG: 30S ribosomal protein S4 [Candidatus Woesearchaeota archaeon]|jgi:small subunit ribosomal protein S4|nr:30S ribosomal protein S4 [Candidatus Woesearchaeota archaeon]